MDAYGCGGGRVDVEKTRSTKHEIRNNFIAGSILQIEPNRFDSGYKPEPACGKKSVNTGSDRAY